MLGNFSFWEIPLLLVSVAFLLALFVGVPVFVVRLLLRSRGPSRAELVAVEERVARLEAERRERLDDERRR